MPAIDSLYPGAKVPFQHFMNLYYYFDEREGCVQPDTKEARSKRCMEAWVRIRQAHPEAMACRDGALFREWIPGDWEQQQGRKPQFPDFSPCEVESGATAAAAASPIQPPTEAGDTQPKLKKEKVSSGSDEEKAPCAASPESQEKTARVRKKDKKVSGASTLFEKKDEPVHILAQQTRFRGDTGDVLGGSLDVDLKGLCISVGDKELLKDAHLRLPVGQRFGLIGRNGCGKSTLMRQMALGRIPGWPRTMSTLLVEQEDVGDSRGALETVMASNMKLDSLWEEERILADGVQHPGKARVAVLTVEALRARREEEEAAATAAKHSGLMGSRARRELVAAEATAAAALEDLQSATHADASSDGIKVQEAEADESGRIYTDEAAMLLTDVREQLRSLDADDAKPRASRLLAGLGIKGAKQHEPTERLSGGWRMRVAIACALFIRPHLLLLDEPSNHLDLRALLWLEKYLVEELDGCTLVVVSHDRQFLDQVATDIIVMKNRGFQYWDGGYTEYEQQQQELNLHRARSAEAIEKRKKEMKEQIQKWEQNARKTGNDKVLKQVASRKKKLDNRMGMERNHRGGYFRINKDLGGYHLTARAEVQVEAAEAEVKLKLPSAEPLGYYGPLLQLEEVTVGHVEGRPIVSNVDLDVGIHSRIAILGENGAGKSTLLATIAEILDPQAGDVKVHPKLRVAYFSQHHLDVLPAELTPLRHLHEILPTAKENDLRGHLGYFGITASLAIQPIATLSGGQKARVVLAAMFMKPPHILLLDEPSNHLDLQTVVALTTALNEFQGGIVLVSHDRRLMEDVAQEYYVVRDGKMSRIEKLSQFLRMLQ